MKLTFKINRPKPEENMAPLLCWDDILEHLEVNVEKSEAEKLDEVALAIMPVYLLDNLESDEAFRKSYSYAIDALEQRAKLYKAYNVKTDVGSA